MYSAQNQGEAFTVLDIDHISKNNGPIWSPEYEKEKNKLIKDSGLEPIHIEVEDIDNLLTEARQHIINTGEHHYYLYPVVWATSKPRELIKAGFMPTCTNLSGKLVSDYVDGVSVKTLRFWWKDYLQEVEMLRELYYCSRWVYTTPEKWKSVSSAMSLSLPFKYHYKDLLYSSNRPINDMSMFRSPKNKVVKTINTADKLIPVTRYGDGMSKGKYQPSTSQNYIGTFYTFGST
jgi:hypothetical protein